MIFPLVAAKFRNPAESVPRKEKTTLPVPLEDELPGRSLGAGKSSREAGNPLSDITSSSTGQFPQDR